MGRRGRSDAKAIKVPVRPMPATQCTKIGGVIPDGDAKVRLRVSAASIRDLISSRLDGTPEKKDVVTVSHNNRIQETIYKTNHHPACRGIKNA